MFNVVVPQLGESVGEARVARWLKKEGDRVTTGEPVVELETEKIDLEVGADHAGVIASIKRREGDDVKVGEVLAVIEEEAAPARPGAPRAEAPPEAPRPEARPEPPRATPTARRIAREHDVDLSRLEGSGPGGRVTKQDVRGALAPPAAAREAAAPKDEASIAPLVEKAAAPTAKGASTPERREERVRMSKRRQTIARRLVEAQRTAAMLTTFNEVDMTAVMALRERRKEAFTKEHGVGLGIVSFFVKAAIAALRAFPQLNAEIQGDEIVLKHYYDIGIAVGAEGGLVVPVLRDADRMSFVEIEQGIRDFASRAAGGALTLEDLMGGTFTITNGGVFGSLLSTPILNPPQVGILGLHKVQDRAVPLDGQVVIRPMMYVALTYDHRMVDGREAVQFLVKIKEFVEDPANLLLVS
jgi:2-oxoglutarate dehydrogenase E2 component (dihydrolipoamide succinyltransferase)